MIVFYKSVGWIFIILAIQFGIILAQAPQNVDFNYRALMQKKSIGARRSRNKKPWLPPTYRLGRRNL